MKLKLTYRAIAFAAAFAAVAFALFMVVGVAVVEISVNGFPTHFQ